MTRARPSRARAACSERVGGWVGCFFTFFACLLCANAHAQQARTRKNLHTETVTHLLSLLYHALSPPSSPGRAATTASMTPNSAARSGAKKVSLSSVAAMASTLCPVWRA